MELKVRRQGEEVSLKYPEVQRRKQVMPLGKQDGVTEATVPEWGFVRCVGGHQTERRRKAEREGRSEQEAMEKMRPWGFLMQTLGPPLVP